MPGKATSQAQWRFMQGVASGSVKARGLTKKAAAEYIAGQSPGGLPERIGPRKTGIDLIKQGLREHRRKHG